MGRHSDSEEERSFLNVLIRRSGLRPPGDILKLLGAALVVVVILMCCIILMDKLGIDVPPGRTLVFYVWITAAVLAVAGTIDWYATGGKTHRRDHQQGFLPPIRA